MAAWAQLLLQLRSFDLFAAAEMSSTSFYRNGLNRNGLFPELSYGRSPRQSFYNPTIKAGLTYKLNGRNYFLQTALTERPLLSLKMHISRSAHATPYRMGLKAKPLFRVRRVIN
ncbi:hypothetical protein [Niabella hibiscisoli]|uniref:hypothetical protein n=1 Tax=Niabella hibiscisoli TaxID=1825928 RepID=UPI001F1180D5|nr:hypothetical protein [Niabella hibiscisoli]MCH5715820.1 hypothetical protein [Niabella hibiscisoli]